MEPHAKAIKQSHVFTIHGKNDDTVSSQPNAKAPGLYAAQVVRGNAYMCALQMRCQVIVDQAV